MPAAHPLDRPVWSALTTRQSSFARGGPGALQLSPDHGPFAAAADRSPACHAALAALEPGKDGLWLVELGPSAAPPGMSVRVTAPCVQMTASRIEAEAPRFEVVTLSEEDAPQMRALAKLTRPGPFAERTHRLGEFVGVRHEGALVAMAGERMKPDGFTEVSGVCTHPDHRGRGYARGLLGLVAGRILDRGEGPFLHAYENNAGAIELYRSMGFEIRARVILTVLERGPG
jgi:predicted GNAT family acetyltransferase